MEAEMNPLLGLLPLLIMGLFYAIPAYLLAKEKGHSAGLWIILAIIPLVNLVSLIYIIGAPSRKLEQQLSEILQRLNAEGR